MDIRNSLRAYSQRFFLLIAYSEQIEKHGLDNEMNGGGTDKISLCNTIVAALDYSLTCQGASGNA
jgi:hypothetical protein